MSRKPLNPHMRGLADGARVADVSLWHWDGVRYHCGFIWVYWPFTVFKSTNERGSFNVTHAPSGWNVEYLWTKREAVALIQSLRTSHADWDFWSGTGQKAKAATKATRHLVRPLVRVG